VVSVTPAENAADVAISANVAATFSEEMDGSTIDAHTFELTKAQGGSPLDAAVSYDAANDTAMLDPNADLDPAAHLHRHARGRHQRRQGRCGQPPGHRQGVVVHHGCTYDLAVDKLDHLNSLTTVG
jgi:hypothetical protein